MVSRHLFLASSSPRRKEILNQLGIKFQTIPNQLEKEVLDQGTGSLKNILRKLAYEKAYYSRNSYKGLILGVDTVVVLNNQILGKPKDMRTAKKMLMQLSGKTHKVYSAICLYDSILDEKICRSESSAVSFKVINEKDIENYCKNYSVLDKAGAYAIQEIGETFISSYQGSYFNIVGLPVNSLLKILKNYVIV